MAFSNTTLEISIPEFVRFEMVASESSESDILAVRSLAKSQSETKVHKTEYYDD
jgi:hypothetical protein